MPKMILIVEDCEDIRGFMKFLVESYGYAVSEAADGLEAVEKFKNTQPDLVLMDISLPLVDGLTATRTIRKLDRGAQVPIVAVTAFGDSYYTRAIEAGCNDLIGKPLDFEKLEPFLDLYLTGQKTGEIIPTEIVPVKMSKNIRPH